MSIKKGEVILLCGTSGCGKTTITRLINGLIPNYYKGNLEGEIYIDNQPISSMTLFDISLKVGSVFQNPRSQFFNVDTTSEIAFSCENQGVLPEIIEKRMEETIKVFDMKLLMDRNIFNLSGGEKQKIAFASIYTALPKVFVLDEPSANLDAKSIEDIKHIIKLLKDAGKTIIISEHRLYYLKDLADRVIYMKDGRITKELSGSGLMNLSENDRINMGLRTIYPESLCLEVHDVGKITETFLECKDFIFSYKNKNAIEINSLKLPVGETIAIIGHNGAGKSTFIRCLCGLEKSCRGKIINDESLLKAKQRIKESYLVMQDTDHQLFKESVEEELMIGNKDNDINKIEKILEALDLTEFRNRHPLSLSGGQKQRLAIAGALVLEKRLIVLDEPTSGLDYIQMNNVVSVINKLKKNSKLIVIVTHDLEFILKSCNYILHIEKGKIYDSYFLDEMGVCKLKKFFNGYDQN